jgi:hypothetical protein
MGHTAGASQISSMAFGGFVQQSKGQPDECPGKDEIGNCAWVSRFRLRGSRVGISLAAIDAFTAINTLGDSIFIPACHPAANVPS